MTTNPLDKRHFEPEVFVDLMTRLQQAVDDHVARFAHLDRATLRMGVVHGAAQVFGAIVRESCEGKTRERVVLRHCITFAEYAGAPIPTREGPSIRRDAPGVN